MADITQLYKKQNRILLLVTVNFLLFLILFSGLGFVVWKSALLVTRLGDDLTKTQETVQVLQTRMQELDTSELVAQVAETASEQLTESLHTSLSEMDVTTPVTKLSDGVKATRTLIEKSDGRLETIQQQIGQLDNELIAQKVAEYVLQGLQERPIGEWLKRADQN